MRSPKLHCFKTAHRRTRLEKCTVSKMSGFAWESVSLGDTVLLPWLIESKLIFCVHLITGNCSRIWNLKVHVKHVSYNGWYSLNAIACENIRFSSLFAAGDVSRKSEEKRMFSQAINAIDIIRAVHSSCSGFCLIFARRKQSFAAQIKKRQ